MESVSQDEVERRIGYWQHILSQIEYDMLKMQSERMNVKHKLVHLHRLQNQIEVTV